jgi:hypothetical protein
LGRQEIQHATRREQKLRVGKKANAVNENEGAQANAHPTDQLEACGAKAAVEELVPAHGFFFDLGKGGVARTKVKGEWIVVVVVVSLMDGGRNG